MHKQIVAMVLAGGRVDELSVLTAKRPKSAVPVWGMYRFIDFALSNLRHSGIDVVGVLSQYRPHSLNGHLAGGAPWDFVGRTRALRILSPYVGAEDTDWYRGTADAVYQNRGFLREFKPEMVLIASGDHIYQMDYRPMIRQHLATGADLTMALKRVPREQAHAFGTAIVDGAGRVVLYEEKARQPQSDLASLTIYVFKTEALIERVLENQADGRSFQIYAEIIPRMVREGARVHAHIFDGYWQYARTLESYYATNLDILGESPPDPAAWGVRTNLEADGMGDPVPALLARSAAAGGSVVCPGAVIAGTVTNSIVSPNVVIEEGAVVRDAVVMHGSVIRRGARVERAILDKNVVVGAGAVIGGDGDITLIGKDCSVPEGASVGAGAILGPDLTAERFPAEGVAAGERLPG